MRDNEDRFVDITIILIAITVVVLKLTGTITISWLWLLSPLWILAGLGFILCVVITLYHIILSLLYYKKENKKNERY
jgi:fatty acid desaturase